MENQICSREIASAKHQLAVHAVNAPAREVTQEQNTTSAQTKWTWCFVKNHISLRELVARLYIVLGYSGNTVGFKSTNRRDEVIKLLFTEYRHISKSETTYRAFSKHSHHDQEASCDFKK